nr:hypothetical protein [Tanacetum cinerariifolium]
MQCLSPKSTGFNEFSRNIATALVCLAANRNYNFSKMIFDGLVKNVNNKGEGSGTPTEPHQTPSPEAQTPSHTTHPSSSLPPITTISIPTVTPTKTTPIRQYTRRTKIAQSSVPPTDSATIDKSSTLPHDSAPHVTSPAAVEGKINQLKERVKQLKEREGVAAINFGDDALIKRRSMDEGEADTERVSDDTKEMATVLTSMDAATVLAIPTGSEEVPTASPVFATATVVTPVIRRNGKEKEDQRRAEQIARDAEIARIHAEEELQSMIDGLDSNNETVAKYLEEYHQFSLELPLERRIELICDLKSSEEITEEAKSPEEVPEEKVKEMMNLVPIEEVYVEALSVKHPIIDWKRLVKDTLSTRPPTSDKEIELWVELSRVYEPDEEDQLQRQRNLYACGEGLPSEEGSSTCDDLLQTSSGELLTVGK